MIKIFVASDSAIEQVILLAEKLQGNCQKQQNCGDITLLHFSFPIPSFGDQFLKAVVLFPEVIL